jgi:hypothetical protein
LRQLREIKDYIAADNPTAPDKVVHEIEERADLLQTMPFGFPAYASQLNRRESLLGSRFRPNGAAISQPRASDHRERRPGFAINTNAQALKGRHDIVRDRVAPSGLHGSFDGCQPRA